MHSFNLICIFDIVYDAKHANLLTQKHKKFLSNEFC